MVDRIGGVEILEPDYAGGSVITVQGSTPKLQVTDYETEELSKLLNGVRYGHSNFTSMSDYLDVCVDHPNASPQEIYAYTLKKNYDNCQTTNHMKIIWIPSSSTNSVWTGTVRVYLNDMQNVYYEEAGIEFNPNGNSYRICLQSHWGSGVRFSPVVLRQTIVQN